MATAEDFKLVMRFEQKFLNHKHAILQRLLVVGGLCLAMLFSVVELANATPSNIAVEWHGYYSYAGNKSVPFDMQIQVTNGTVVGRTSEQATLGSGSIANLHANISGSIQGPNIFFTKTYDGTGGINHSVEYRGNISSDGRVMAGTWRLGMESGTFTASVIPIAPKSGTPQSGSVIAATSTHNPQTLTIFVDGIDMPSFVKVVGYRDLFVGPYEDRSSSYLKGSPIANIFSSGEVKEVLWNGDIADNINVKKAVNELEFILLEASHECGKKINVVAHSMGTVISYLALLDLKFKTKEYKGCTYHGIDNFITLASPLVRWPSVVKRKLSELGYPSFEINIRPPGDLRIQRWINAYAQGDIVGGSIDVAGIKNLPEIKTDVPSATANSTPSTSMGSIKAHSLPYTDQVTITRISNLLSGFRTNQTEPQLSERQPTIDTATAPDTSAGKSAVTSDNALQLGLEGADVTDKKGVTACKVSQVHPGTPAANAGIKADDIIVRFDGKLLNGCDDLKRIVSATQAGKTVSVEIIDLKKRIRQTLQVELTHSAQVGAIASTVGVNRSGQNQRAIGVSDAQGNLPPDKLITSKSVGLVQIGMSVAQVRKVLPNMKLVLSSDGDGASFVEVKDGDTDVMSMYPIHDQTRPINDRTKIEYVLVCDGRYATKEGVHPGMLLRDVEDRYGKLIEITMSEIESREEAEFARMPTGITLRVGGVNYSQAGIYPQGKRQTTQFYPDASVRCIAIDWRAESEKSPVFSESSRVLLPPEFKAELDRSFPGWKYSEVAQEVRQYFGKISEYAKASLNMVRGDFDGNGQPDFAVMISYGQASNRRNRSVVALLNKGSRIEVHELGPSEYLLIQRKGKKIGGMVSEDKSIEFTLANDAISVGKYESSSSVHFYERGKFQTIWTSD